MKKFLLVLLILIIAIGGAIYHFRYEIFQYSAEGLIKNNLPPFVVVDRIIFDLKNHVMKITKLRIKNPAEFQNKFLASVDLITCEYKMKGASVMEGIEITDITTKDIVIDIERLGNGTINISKMDEVMSAPADGKTSGESPKESKLPPVDISKLIELPEVINIKNGEINFTDNYLPKFRPYRLTFSGVNGTLGLKLSDDFKEVKSMTTEGEGFVGGDPRQSVAWNIYLKPQSAQLNMNNNIEVKDVNLMPFKPYYDEYAPVDVKSGSVSGKLTIDFENGNIGSTNTIVLRDLKFIEREGGFASGAWDVSIADIVKYLQSSSGDIIFDFKIKGDMNKPTFYPGPQLKQAMQSMVVDKVSSVIRSLSGSGEEPAAGAAAGEQSDVDKAVNVIRGLLNR